MERDALRDLGERLSALSIGWAIFGAVAANRYRREVRLSGDVDLLLASHGAGVGVLERALAEGGWTVRRASPDGSVLRTRHPQLGAADLVLAETDYQRLAIARSRVETDSSGAAVRFLTPEDVIVHKLIAGRPRDVDDIESILRAGTLLDERYIEEWAGAWEVGDLWERLSDSARRR